MFSSTHFYLHVSTPRSHPKMGTLVTCHFRNHQCFFLDAVMDVHTFVTLHLGTLSPSTEGVRVVLRLRDAQWCQEQGCFITGSWTSHLALKAQERLHLDTRQKRSKPRNTNMPVVWGRQQVTRREPHILDCRADAIHLRGHHKPNKYSHSPFPWSLMETKSGGFHLKPRGLHCLQLAHGLLPHPAYTVLDENWTLTNKITKEHKTALYVCLKEQ